MSDLLASDEGRAILGMAAVVAGSAVATFTEPQGVWLFVTVVGVSLAVVGGTYMVIVPADTDSE